MDDVVERHRAQYDPEAAQRRLLRESQERIWERRPRKRLTRTRAGVLYEFIDVADDELPAFVRARR